MPRRYRIDTDSPDWPVGLTQECTAEEFADANNADTVLEVYALTLGQSVTLGGGAAPLTVITCIEE